jgi:hypothetical protein
MNFKDGESLIAIQNEGCIENIIKKRKLGDNRV